MKTLLEHAINTVSQFSDDFCVTGKSNANSEVLEEYKYLAFILLGADYLETMGDYENAIKGKDILLEKVLIERKKIAWKVEQEELAKKTCI